MSKMSSAARDLRRVSNVHRRNKTRNVAGVQRMPGYGGAFRMPTAPKPLTFGHGQLRGFDGRYITGGSGYHWLGLDEIVANIIGRGKAVEKLPKEAFDELAPAVLSYMKANATWSDRTGEARAQLQVHVTTDKDGSALLWAGHGVYYGWYLETMQGGRFGILEKTMREFVVPNLPKALQSADKGVE